MRKFTKKDKAELRKILLEYFDSDSAESIDFNYHLNLEETMGTKIPTPIGSTIEITITKMDTKIFKEGFIMRIERDLTIEESFFRPGALD